MVKIHAYREALIFWLKPLGAFSDATYSLAVGAAAVMKFYLMTLGLPLRKAIDTTTDVILSISLGL